MTTKHQCIVIITLVLVVCAGVIFGAIGQNLAVTVGAAPATYWTQGPADLPLEGWLWTPNIGWISFCGGKQATTTCPGTTTYQVFVDNSNGEFKGYAWAGNASTTSSTLVFGSYLSFNRAETGVPPAPPFDGSETFIARIDLNAPVGSRNMQGWGRFLAACDQDPSGRCLSSGPGVNSGGWDGWVLFSSGVDSYGIVYGGFEARSAGATGVLVGEAYGGEVVGWIVASTTGVYSPAPQVALPTISVVLTADPTEGTAPLGVTLTAVVTTSSTLPITYDFDCDVNPTSPNTQQATVPSNSTTTAFVCTYDVPENYRPVVTVRQNGVFATAADTSLVTNITGGSITVRRSIIREIPVDE